MKGSDLFPLRITGRIEDKNGANTHYKLSDGSIITRKLAVEMRKNGFLKDYNIFERNGVEYLRDNRDSDIKDNIDNQPLFTFQLIELPEQK
jgi:hypothetical protein